MVRLAMASIAMKRGMRVSFARRHMMQTTLNPARPMSLSTLPDFVHRFEGPSSDAPPTQDSERLRPTRIVLAAGLDGAVGPGVDALARIKNELSDGSLEISAKDARLDIILGGPSPAPMPTSDAPDTINVVSDTINVQPKSNLLGSTCVEEVRAGQPGGYSSIAEILEEAEVLVCFESSTITDKSFVRIGGPGLVDRHDLQLASYFRNYAAHALTKVEVALDPNSNLWKGQVSTPDEFVREMKRSDPDGDSTVAAVVVDTGNHEDACTYSSRLHPVCV
jgi:hypothetical protein